MKKFIFIVFFISGFCGLIYQIIWLRLAYASFGINTQVMSALLSTFMMGLAIGSWIVGKYIGSLIKKLKINVLYLYAITEFLIGLSAFIVPAIFLLGREWLLVLNETSSLNYLIISVIIIILTILPWCLLMGATIPLVMMFIKKNVLKDEKSFSFLYLANTTGAILGTAFTAFIFIELFGLQKTLYLAAFLNFIIAIICFITASQISKLYNKPIEKRCKDDSSYKKPYLEIRLTPLILFFTGFSSMGLEVIWTRLFTPILTTTVYSFAFILILYLLGTCVGSTKYRIDLKKNNIASTQIIIVLLILSTFFQILINDPRLHLGPLGIIISIFTFSFLLGYLTPKLIDQLSLGNPKIAGKVYAINIIGCVLGPLFASYLLLPIAGAKLSIVILGIPFLFFLITSFRFQLIKFRQKIIVLVIIILFIFSSIFINTSYEEGPTRGKKIIKRDYSATVIAYGQNLQKNLLVNGIGITNLTPITKVMAHLPLALNKKNPKKVLVICFGMGTTFRSSMSWDLETTAIELTPSVKNLFGYFFDDAGILLKNEKGQIIIDDGRRYLQRTKNKYDLITIDPPPPVEAAGSSFLYSKEFYEIAKQHLTKSGILQQWYPGNEGKTLKAVARSIIDVFPYVKVYQSIEGWGYHFLASIEPIQQLTPEEIVAKLPPKAKYDLIEWNVDQDKEVVIFVEKILAGERVIKQFLEDNKNIKITDDYPYNEYYLLRKYFKI